jgi:hypothetical protein
LNAPIAWIQVAKDGITMRDIAMPPGYAGFRIEKP